MSEDVSSATSVDVLIERLSSHPQEFYNASAVVSYDGEKIFSGTKYRRIVTTLMVDKQPGEQNLWIDLFTEEERQRFRRAMIAALRGDLDTQIMRTMMGDGDPFAFDPDGQRRREWEQHVSIRQNAHGLGHVNAPGAFNRPGAFSSLSDAAQTISAWDYQAQQQQLARADYEATKTAVESPLKSLRSRITKGFF